MAKRWVASDPAVMMGKPVIAGTRITVELVLDKLAAGESIQQIVAAHPRLTRRAVLAALAFAAEALRADVTYPTGGQAGGSSPTRAIDGEIGGRPRARGGYPTWSVRSPTGRPVS